MQKNDRGYLAPADFSEMIMATVNKDFSEYHPEAFADTLMMSTDDHSLGIIKAYISAMAWYLKNNGVIGWETESGKTILKALAQRMSDEENYDFILELLSSSLE